MPNWCTNKLEVSGPLAGVRRFVEAQRDDAASLSFAKSVPEPEGLEGRLLTWRVAHWGTKWDLDDETDLVVSEDAERDRCEAVYNFFTAWSPPLEWLAVVVEQYPNLVFRLVFAEPGMAFMGEGGGSEGRFSHEIYEIRGDSALLDELDIAWDEDTDTDDETA